jgi:glycosyltransferase involved in cell wall biosynthesis
VPPSGYGGTERIVSYLTEQLVQDGHDVTLFASGDSRTKARLVPITLRSLRLDPGCIDQLAHHLVMLDTIFGRRDEFDIIHFHIDYLHFPLSKWLECSRLTTLHGRLDYPDLQPLYRTFSDEPVISISDSQRRPLPGANWLGTVYHGLPRDLYPFTKGPDNYLAFVGRVSPEKRLDRAIEIAQRTGIRLKIAAKIDPIDRAYFEREIEHLLDDPLVEFVGEIGEESKGEFLGRARALLFPIDWEEPFGLVMIEALACGTPVVAFRRGSVPEVLTNGLTGYIVESTDEAVAAVGNLDAISRQECREEFERRFSVERMAGEYVRIYREILEGRAEQPETVDRAPDTWPRALPVVSSI